MLSCSGPGTSSEARGDRSGASLGTKTSGRNNGARHPGKVPSLRAGLSELLSRTGAGEGPGICCGFGSFREALGSFARWSSFTACCWSSLESGTEVYFLTQKGAEVRGKGEI